MTNSELARIMKEYLQNEFKELHFELFQEESIDVLGMEIRAFLKNENQKPYDKWYFCISSQEEKGKESMGIKFENRDEPFYSRVEEYSKSYGYKHHELWPLWIPLPEKDLIKHEYGQSCSLVELLTRYKILFEDLLSLYRNINNSKKSV